MALISTSALRKITIFVLAVAIASFTSAEIHKRLIVPRQESQQTQVQTQILIGEKHPPTVSEYIEIMGVIDGVFQGWEDIEDSPDKYALLATSQTGELFPKIRVGFEFSSLYGDGTGREDATVFAVEKGNGEYDVLGYLKDFTPKEIDKLIETGGKVKIVLKRGMDRVENLEDKGGNLLAHWLFVKREFGKEAVENEIGRVTQRL